MAVGEPFDRGRAERFRRTERRRHSGETLMVHSVWRMFAKETNLGWCGCVCCAFVGVRSMLLVGVETLARDAIGERVVRSLTTVDLFIELFVQ